MIKIEANNRTALVGATGTGKTYMARYLLARVPRLVALDPKGTLKNQWGLTEWNRSSRRALARGEPLRVRATAEPGDNDFYESVLGDAYDAGNVIIYIDEVYGVAPVGSRPGPMLSAVYTRGREFGIGVVAATQRPTWVPLFIFSEADNYIMFRLKLQNDRRRMAEFMGPDVLSDVRSPHGFWIYQNNWISENKPPRYYDRLVVRQLTE